MEKDIFLGITPNEVLKAVAMYLIIRGIIYGVAWILRGGKKQSERMQAIQIHVYNHARRTGHYAKSAVDCQDGKCALI